MKAQTPAKGIATLHQDNTSASYRIDCECTCDDHAVTTYIEVEPDEDGFDEIAVRFFVKLWTPVFGGFAERVKCAFNVLFRGKHTQEHEILLSTQSAKNWISAVDKTINELNDERIQKSRS